MKQIIIRPRKTQDAPSLAAAANHPKIAQNLRNVFPHPYTIEDAAWFINDCIEKEATDQLLRAIEADGTAIGGISIAKKEDVYEKSAELGYWLSKDYWNQGITTQAVKMICKEAFDRFDIIRIFAEPFAHNAGSRAVLEKAGFTYEGTMRDGVYKNGCVHSYCMYSLLRKEAQLLYGE